MKSLFLIIYLHLSKKDIKEAENNIEELFNKIEDIKLKASQSELMVQDLCVDIKKLDYAKNHLQTSITSLNRLQMLINAVNQLEVGNMKCFRYQYLWNYIYYILSILLYNNIGPSSRSTL
jgi:hypothetical protein